MPESNPRVEPESRPLRERRDVDPPLLALIAVGLTVLGALLLVFLWDILRAMLPDARGGDVTPPLRMPGEASVNARVEALPRPRLEPLVPLRAEDPSARSSRPVPGSGSPELHAEDLRANRQPQLNDYSWVDREGGIARIPIDRAMDAIVESGRLDPSTKTKGGPP